MALMILHSSSGLVHNRGKQLARSYRPCASTAGRFAKLLYVGVNSDTSYREWVLKALTRKFKLHEDVSLFSIAKKCSPNFTSADMYALCSDAWFQAAKRTVSTLHSASSSTVNQADVVVKYDDFVNVHHVCSFNLILYVWDMHICRFELFKLIMW